VHPRSCSSSERPPVERLRSWASQPHDRHNLETGTKCKVASGAPASCLPASESWGHARHKMMMMMIAKGIGGGFPLCGVLANEEAASGMTAGTHGSTYGGNPLGCAVGLAVMDHVTTPAFLEDVNRKAGLLRQKAEGLVADHPEVFEEVRGIGLMLGIKCKLTNSDVVNAGYDNEIITVVAGDNAIRLLPPLTLTEEDIGEAIIRLDKAATQLEADLTTA